MAITNSCNKHNMIACVEKTERNTDFHEVIDFLTGCCVNYALLVSPDVIRQWIQQFWGTAKVRMINEVSHIEAKVAGKKILVSEASIRADFPQWKYLVHTLLHCLSSKSSSWDQFGTNIASALVGLAINQKFNFSKMIFDGMIRHIKDVKPFLMYPKFIQLFLNKQLEGIAKPQNFLPTVVLPQKVFTFMSKSSTKFSGRITPLTPHMLEVATAVKDEHSVHNEEPEITPSPSHHSGDYTAGEKENSPSQVAVERSDSPYDYTPTDKAAQILKLKEKVKNLVKKVKHVIVEYRYFVKIKASLSKKKKLGKTHKKKSSSFKQGRKVSDGDSDVEDSTPAETSKSVGIEKQNGEIEQVDLGSENIQKEIGSGDTDVFEDIEDTKANESIAEPSIQAVEDEAGPSTFLDETTEFFQDDTLIADILVNISRPKRGAGITIPGNVPEQERSESPTPVLDPKDKGKGIMKEEPKKKKLTLQQIRAAKTANDAEVARRIAAEWEEDEERKRLVGLEKLQAELEANEMISAKMQRAERDNFTEEQKAKFLVETIAAQRRFRAEKQAAFRRSRPPTIPQLRN
ncbi:hypothetical protein Tco_0653210 [Tanacetum coccineum]|uniref:Uncharacterized protein n=1 Tax=Tanacetum coccineum TaxID=301880 RepID=A0ABQ4X0I5_9ASTR